MTRFTDDNTEGYTAEQLAELNRRYEEQVASLLEANTSPITAAPAWFFREQETAIAEHVLRDYDSEVHDSTLTPETRAAIRTTYLSSIMQGQRKYGNGTLTPAEIREDAREFVLWLGETQSTAGNLDMWYVPSVTPEALNAVMDAVDAEQGGEA